MKLTFFLITPYFFLNLSKTRRCLSRHDKDKNNNKKKNNNNNNNICPVRYCQRERERERERERKREQKRAKERAKERKRD